MSTVTFTSPELAALAKLVAPLIGSTGTPPPPMTGDAPTAVKATAQPYTALVGFTEMTAPAGKTIAGYHAVSSSQGWLQGGAPHSPIQVQGGQPGWGGASNQFQVRANYTDGTFGGWSDPSNAVTPTGGTANSQSPNILVGSLFYWAGSYDYGQSGVQYGNGMTLTSTAFGGWQPFAPNNTFDLSPYSFLELDLKGVAGQTWSIYFEQNGDTAPIGENPVIIDGSGKYGPAPSAGQWGSYKIPLKDLNLGAGTPNTIIYKLQVHGRLPGVNQWIADNVKFA